MEGTASGRPPTCQPLAPDYVSYPSPLVSPALPTALGPKKKPWPFAQPQLTPRLRAPVSLPHCTARPLALTILEDVVPGFKVLPPHLGACPAGQAPGHECELHGGLEHGLQGMDEFQTGWTWATAKEAQLLSKEDQVAGCGEQGAAEQTAAQGLPAACCGS